MKIYSERGRVKKSINFNWDKFMTDFSITGKELKKLFICQYDLDEMKIGKEKLYKLEKYMNRDLKKYIIKNFRDL